MELTTVAALFERFLARGKGAYTLSQVSQLEHGLQAAALAQERKLGDVLTIAALFHDLGHLPSATNISLAERGIDDRHEHASARILERVFGQGVSEPVRLHVLAKRYLCTVEEGYLESLDGDSQCSLAVQGGALTASEIASFKSERYFRKSLDLRRIDDDAKVPGLDVPGLDAYREMALDLSLHERA